MEQSLPNHPLPSYWHISRLIATAAISLFGFNSRAALATVVGVLIEVPATLQVVAIVNNSKG